eukprot:TRINITY_DN9869_c0_g2_i1.p2 TRINITY_DN9869_c0_g2~~TRINITY_DN9869_c0_g2_i1.p2  ORF type:complete len:120 (+),score=2.34 TRINITY_DN9869_c0_g2_i1:536-895(+)
MLAKFRTTALSPSGGVLLATSTRAKSGVLTPFPTTKAAGGVVTGVVLDEPTMTGPAGSCARASTVSTLADDGCGPPAEVSLSRLSKGAGAETGSPKLTTVLTNCLGGDKTAGSGLMEGA